MAEPKPHCECEHAAHFGRGLTPNTNPGHKYGQDFVVQALTPVKTAHGTFNMCPDCLNDCATVLASKESPHYVACFVYCKTMADWDKLQDFMEERRSQYDWEEQEEFRIEKGTPFSADLE